METEPGIFKYLNCKGGFTVEPASLTDLRALARVTAVQARKTRYAEMMNECFWGVWCAVLIVGCLLRPIAALRACRILGAFMLCEQICFGIGSKRFSGEPRMEPAWTAVKTPAKTYPLILTAHPALIDFFGRSKPNP